MLWSVRRELWEHRSVWLAPVGVAALAFVAFLVGISGHEKELGRFEALRPEARRLMVVMPFSLAASAILFTAFITGVIYSLDALVGERRDRSILFWKSMPVSDRTTVLSKAAIALAVLPAVGFGVALATQLGLLAMAAAALAAKGQPPAPLWEMLPFASMTVVMLYGVVVHALWFAPLYALCLLLSAAVRRPAIWLVVPLLVVQVLEKLAFGTSYSGTFIRYRLLGAMAEAFKPDPMKEAVTSLAQLDPIRFLSSPGLWLGLVAAAAMLYVAIRLRRSREPLS